jgi:hypothetical protein
MIPLSGRFCKNTFTHDRFAHVRSGFCSAAGAQAFSQRRRERKSPDFPKTKGNPGFSPAAGPINPEAGRPLFKNHC